MSDVARLESELQVAKASEKLEKARERFHRNRKDKAAHTAFKKASKIVADLRRAHRENFGPREPEPGDGVAHVPTIQVKARRG